MSVVFLETSALLRAVFDEAGGELVRRRLAGAQRILASRLLKLEAERALLRVSIDHPALASRLPTLERELRGLWSHVDMLEMTRDLCELAGRIAPASRLRSLDAIHLATYRRVCELVPNVELLSFDQRILDAA